MELCSELRRTNPREWSSVLPDLPEHVWGAGAAVLAAQLVSQGRLPPCEGFPSCTGTVVLCPHASMRKASYRSLLYVAGAPASVVTLDELVVPDPAALQHGAVEPMLDHDGAPTLPREAWARAAWIFSQDPECKFVVLPTLQRLERPRERWQMIVATYHLARTDAMEQAAFYVASKVEQFVDEFVFGASCIGWNPPRDAQIPFEGSIRFCQVIS